MYNFLRAQEDVSKKFLNLDINLSGDLEYYIRVILDGATDEKFDVHINSTSNLSFIVLLILDNHSIFQLLQ